MNLFFKLEELSEKFIEGIFRGKNTSLQPVEIAKKLAREMDSQQKISVSKVYVPNDYQVVLNREDKAKLVSLENSLAHELAEYLKHRAIEKDYFFSGEVKVALEEDEKLEPFQIKIESKFTEDPLKLGESQVTSQNTQIFQEPLTTAPSKNNRAEIVVIRGQDEGMTFRLANFPAYLGRRRANAIFVDDISVSRKHALIDQINGNYFLADQNSLNGTFVNQQEIARVKLEDGDLITVGSTLLKFRMVSE